MATETRSKFNKVYVPGLFAVAKENFQRYPETWRELVGVRNSKKAYEESTFITGYGFVPQKADGAPIQYDARLQGYSKKWVHNEFALGARITENTIEDDLYNVMEGAAADLAVSMRETKHLDVATIFNTGFGTTVKTAGDSLAIFSASHVRMDGSTWSNLATAANMSYSVLQAMLMAFETAVDHRGKKVHQMPMTVLVHPNNRAKMMQLLQSVGQPETANNDMNPTPKMYPGLKLVVWPYLTSTNASFLLGDNAKLDTGLIHFNRRATRFAREGDFETGDSKFKVDGRWSTEVNYPLGLYGNAGL